MAVSGPPTSHGDDAERAVRAALELGGALEAVDPGLRLRIGINTGEVLAGVVGPAGGYTVTGDAVNTAHRLAESAAPGEILVGERTRAAAPTVTFAARGSLALKGKAEPVPVWAAEAVVEPPPAGDLPAVPLGPLVGRDREVRDLREQVEAAASAPRSGLTFLVGEAGVGKTRLAQEVAERVLARSPRTRLVWVTCPSYAADAELAPVAELARSALALPTGTDLTEQRRLLDRRLAAVGLGDRAGVLGPRLADLLGLGEAGSRPVDVEPRSVRVEPSAQQLAAVGTLLGATARSSPTLVVVDDLHWAGRGLSRFLVAVAERLAHLPIFFLGIGRDDVLERHGPVLRRGRIAHTTVLGPLDDEAATALVATLLAERGGTGRIGPAALERLVRTAGGNPLLLEQLVGFLVEAGQLALHDDLWLWDEDPESEQPIPDGLRSLIGARLDALDPPARSLVADAAVAGRRFWRDALVDLGDRSDDEVRALLDELVARGLVTRGRRGPDGDWEFGHVLTRDVAYASMPLGERAERHALLATWLEDRAHHEGEPVPPALLAHHYDRAVTLARAVDHEPTEVLAPAFAALVHAARDDARRDGLRRADRWYRRALAVGSADEDEVIEVLAEHGRVLLEVGEHDEAEATFRELRRRAGHTRPPMAALAEANLGAVARLQGQPEVARELFDASIARWRALEDPQGVADTFRLQGWAEFVAGRPRAAMARLRRAAALEEQIEEPVRHGETLRYLGWCELLDGHLADAQAHLWTAAGLAAAGGETGETGWCLGLLGHAFLRRGHAGRALEMARSVRVQATANEDPWSEWTCAALEAAALVSLGRVAEGGALAEAAAERFTELEAGWELTVATLVAAQAARRLGDLDRARALLHAAGADDRVPGVPDEDARVLAELALVELQLGAVGTADRLARSALGLARAGVGDDESRIQSLVVLARAAARRDDPAAAEVLLEDAIADRAPGDRTEWWYLAALDLAEQRLDRGDRAGATSLVAAVEADEQVDARSVRRRIEGIRRRLRPIPT